MISEELTRACRTSTAEVHTSCYLQSPHPGHTHLFMTAAIPALYCAYTSRTHLVQVLGLDLVSGLAHLAGSLGVGKHQLVDNDVVCVDAALGQLLDQPLRLVQGQELGDAHADERRLLLSRGNKTG